MFSNINLISVLLLVRILELPNAVVCIDDLKVPGRNSCRPKASGSVEINNTDWDVRCKFQPNSWNCFKNNQNDQHRFYYDLNLQTCNTFQYGGCSLSYNSFTMLTECSDFCFEVGAQNLSPQKMDKLAPEVVCRLQPEFGSCFDYQPQYYYDISTRTCKGFSYSGCGGNPNKFDNQFTCIDFCESVVPEYELAETGS